MAPFTPIRIRVPAFMAVKITSIRKLTYQINISPCTFIYVSISWVPAPPSPCSRPWFSKSRQPFAELISPTR